MCFLAFILREVKEGAGLLESQCTFSFEGVGGILVGTICYWVVILGSGCVKICYRLACWERGVQCVGSWSRNLTPREPPWKQKCKLLQLLIASAKILERKGSISPSSFYG